MPGATDEQQPIPEQNQTPEDRQQTLREKTTQFFKKREKRIKSIIELVPFMASGVGSAVFLSMGKPLVAVGELVVGITGTVGYKILNKFDKEIEISKATQAGRIEDELIRAEEYSLKDSGLTDKQIKTAARHMGARKFREQDRNRKGKS